MAGYATVSDVAALNVGRATYTANTKPTASQVVDYIEEASAELDGILRSRGYTAPVPTTATSARRMLEGYNAIGAWQKVEHFAEASERKEEAWRMWMDAKKMLMDGLIELDAPRETTTSVPRAPSVSTSYILRDAEF